MSEMGGRDRHDDDIGAKDPVREFAENLVDDLRIAETVRERDATDNGKRLSLEELADELGVDLQEVKDEI